MKQTHKHISGFTLIELMIAVAVVGILAAIGYPSYLDYVQRANRAEGMDMLTRAQANQERHFTNNNSYATTLQELGYPSNSPVSENGYYRLSIEPATGNCPTATCYALTVTAQNEQARDTSCATLTLTSTGDRTATSTDCWQR